MLSRHSTIRSRSFRKKTSRPVLAGFIGTLLLLAGIVPFPALLGQGTVQPQGQPPVQPANPAAAAPQVQTPPPQVQLSILLLMDVSGSMASNNKLDQAKEAAIRAVTNALKVTTPTLPPGQQPAGTGVAPIPIGPHTPGIPTAIVREFDKNLTALEELQAALGPDIRSWLSKAESKGMGDILKRCNQLMEGLAFEQKSELMKRLSPLVEKMHYSIASRVNQEVGGGLKYVIPGKTPANPEFGGLFTLKPSDHDAIYLGAADKADEAVRLHQQLARQYGDDFLTMTESCLESSRYTLERLPSGMLPEAYEKFSGPTSNLDWMRTKSGSKWVQEYVDQAGKVVDLDILDDATNINKAMRELKGLSDAELQNLGVIMDRSTALDNMGYNLGLQSDFERQLALNRARKALEKGLPAAAADDTAMLMAKYGPRYREVLEGAGVSVEQSPWKGYVEELTAVGKKAKAGTALEAADEAVLSRFDEFARYVRQESLAQQVNKYAALKQSLSDAFRAGDRAKANAIRSQMVDLLDDTQGALHNFQQLGKGNAMVDDMLRQIGQTQDDMASLLRDRLTNRPWVSTETSIEKCVEAQAHPTAAVGPKLVIPDAKTMWEYTKANPGHVFAKVAQYGAYIYVGYEFNSLLKEGKIDEAVSMAEQFGAMEATTFIAGKLLQAKFGAWAGPGVALAGTIGLAIGDGIAQSLISGQVNDMSLEMMSGYSGDGSQAYQGKGFLESLSSARITNFQNQAAGRNDRWIDFDAPSEAANMTDDQIMSLIKPGTYGDTTISIDANGRVTYRKDKGMKWEMDPSGYGMVQVPDIEVTAFDKNQIIAHQRLGQMYQAMRGKYNADLAGGQIGTDTGNVPGDFRYTDPYASIPGSAFDIPNPGGLTMHEFTYYRMLFDRSWSKWALDKNPNWQDTAYWNSTMENAYKAKWSMFRSFIQSMSEGKMKDREFQEKLAKDSPEDLAALKLMADQGLPIWLDGRKLTSDEIQTMIDKKLADRQNILDQIQNGIIHIKLPADLEKILGELSSMSSGNVEIGIMPYSGGCSSTFSLFPFSQDSNVLTSAINSLSAGGGTPMSPALYQARHAILAYANGRSGLIILLCDGQNDCSENPVKAADNIRQSTFPANPGGIARLIRSIGRELGRFQLVPSLYAQAAAPTFTPIDMNRPIPAGRRNLPITVSTVGFQVNDSQQQVLDEIARAGGGISGSAQNIDQLTTAFTSAIQTATQGIPMGGGGGMVLPASRFNWMTGLIIGLSVLIIGLIAAILIVRSRRSAGSGAPAGAPVYAVLDVAYSDGGVKSVGIRGTTTIGRGTGNGVVLHDEMVSGRHAELLVSRDGFLLRDLGSANGTFVNGRQIGEQYLAAGDQIKMGETTLTFRGN